MKCASFILVHMEITCEETYYQGKWPTSERVDKFYPITLAVLRPYHRCSGLDNPFALASKWDCDWTTLVSRVTSIWRHNLRTHHSRTLARIQIRERGQYTFEIGTISIMANELIGLWTGMVPLEHSIHHSLKYPQTTVIVPSWYW